jgi:polyferredoxin
MYPLSTAQVLQILAIIIPLTLSSYMGLKRRTFGFSLIPWLTLSSSLLIYDFNLLVLTSVFTSFLLGLDYLLIYRRRGRDVTEEVKVALGLLVSSTSLAILQVGNDLGVNLYFPTVFAFLWILTLLTTIKAKVTSRMNSSPRMALGLISVGFLTSLSLAISVDFFQVNPTSLSSLEFLAPSGVGIIVDGMGLLLGITSSSWFMVMIGVWLGVGVMDKIISARKLENRVRLSLMFLAYWVYSIYLPSFSPFSSVFPEVPYSWFNGFGTFAPVEPSLLLGILGTYLVTAVLSYLFGSRQICSVTCTAPYMLQGSFVNSMKTFNRSSPLGRRTLTSRLSPWFKVISLMVWVNIAVFAAISYLNQVGVTNFSVLGDDPSMFLSSLYFNLIWYLQFLMIPFLGNYSCVTSGLCGWGTFNQLFGYLGPFKLKVKDPATCLSCKTVDCAKACPVGLTDMRASFIKKGEFKAFKCIGAGECIEECPYDNIFVRDGRVYLRKLLGRGAVNG